MAYFEIEQIESGFVGHNFVKMSHWYLVRVDTFCKQPEEINSIGNF